MENKIDEASKKLKEKYPFVINVSHYDSVTGIEYVTITIDTLPKHGSGRIPLPCCCNCKINPSEDAYGKMEERLLDFVKSVNDEFSKIKTIVDNINKYIN